MSKKARNNSKNAIWSNMTKFFIVLIVTIVLVLLGTNLEETENVFNENTVKTLNVGELPEDFSLSIDSNLQIIFFNVGQGDCILVSDNGENMLIDAGNNEDSKYIVEYLKKLGIGTIDYLVATHAHSDHIGGMNNVIDEFNIGYFLIPRTSETLDINDYKELKSSMSSKSVIPQEPKIGDEFYIGDAKCTIKYIDNNLPSEMNNASIVIEMTLGEQDYLFMGDAEEQVEKSKQVVFTEIEVLKVGHHGSAYSSSQKFINDTSPEIAIISVGKNGYNNMPDEQKGGVLERLKAICGEDNVYRTDKDNTIYIQNIDGKNIVKELKTNVDGNAK